MFWINFEWLVFAKPYSLEVESDNINLNNTSKLFRRAMPEKYQGLAITLEVIMED